jgi:SAM-dependent methyltransferase
MKGIKMNCKLCHSSNTRLYHNKILDINNGRVFRCNDCDVIFIDPFPTADEIEQICKKHNEIVKQRNHTLTTSPQEIFDMSKHEMRRRFEFLKKYFAHGSSFCEIGSSTGSFLALLKQECAINTYAVEINEENLKFSSSYYIQGFSIVNDIPKNLLFDSIGMFRMLQHITSPIEYLKEVKKHLSPSGQLILELICGDDPLLELYNVRAFKDFTFIPIHVFVQSGKSLKYLLEQVGFESIEIIPYNRYGLANHINWMLNGKPESLTIDSVIRSVVNPLQSAYSDALIQNGYYDTLYCVAK